MWDGITWVDPNSGPVIYEGFASAHAIIMNSGPANIDLLVWSEPSRQPGDAPIRMLLRPGTTRSVSGAMIKLMISEDQRGAGPLPSTEPPFRFAAVGWRITA
jgi:hypothetical protein